MQERRPKSSKDTLTHPRAHSTRRVWDRLVLGSPKRIERELGWKAKHTEIESMIRTAWDWRQKKGGNWGKEEDLKGKEEKSACAPL